VTPTKDNPATADLSESCGYLVRYWISEYTDPKDPLVIDFRLYRPHEEEIWECEFGLKWDGCINLFSYPHHSMHFCSHEGVRAFAACLLKCFELAGTIMTTRKEEFLDDDHHDSAEVMAILTGKT